MFQMAAGEIGQPGPHAVLLVVVELKTELARAATLPLQMVDYLVQDQALKEPHVTLKHAMPQEVSFCKKKQNNNDIIVIIIFFSYSYYYCLYIIYVHIIVGGSTCSNDKIILLSVIID
jgi:hypothetical protein